ncbi:MAG: hypothetical protein ACRDAM_14435, partial [Casimicrobium sp.]
MSTLSYTEHILQHMHARALRGVVLALLFSALLHLAITLVQLGGDKFGIRFDRPDKSGDPMRARLQPRIEPPPQTPVVAPTPQVTPRTAPAPTPADRATVTMVPKAEIPPPVIAPEPPKTEPVVTPPEPITRTFEPTSAPPTRVERVAPVAVPQPITPSQIQPLPPIEI